MTSSMCWPHPRQVIFPQRAQRAGEHMMFPSLTAYVRAVGKQLYGKASTICTISEPHHDVSHRESH
jgi:hypothetical protein